MHPLLSLFIFFGLVGSSVLFLSSLAHRREQWTQGTHRLLWRPWDGLSALWLFGLLIVMVLALGTLLSLAARLVGLDLANPSMEYLLVVMFTSYGATFGLVRWFLRERNNSWMGSFDHRPLSWIGSLGWGLFGYLASLLFVGLAGWVSQKLLEFFQYDAPPQDFFEFLSQPQRGVALALLVLVAVVGAPLIEEMLFRGILFPALSRRFGVGIGMIVSSMVFSMIHMNVGAAAPLFVLAVGLCLLYIYTGSLRACIFMHAVFNAIAITLFLLGEA